MGRTIRWHALSRLVHTADASCFGWDSSPGRVLASSVSCREFCPACLTVAVGPRLSPCRVASYRVTHAYRSPVWGSDWSVPHTRLGTRRGELARRFRRASVREITSADVARLDATLAFLGEPLTAVDRRARSETAGVSDFLRTWLRRPGVSVLIEDEP